MKPSKRKPCECIILLFVLLRGIDYDDMRFDEFDLTDDVLDGLDAMNFFEATPIQEATIPDPGRARSDSLCADGHRYKTATYVLPIISELSKGTRDAVNAVIMAPTRELAQQIDQQIEAFSYFLSISAVWLSTVVRMVSRGSSSDVGWKWEQTSDRDSR